MLDWPLTLDGRSTIPRNKGINADDVVRLWESTDGNVSAIARELGIARRTVRYHLRNAGAYKRPSTADTSAPDRPRAIGLPPAGKIRRVIITSAQNNVKIHAGLWRNLKALEAHWGAEIWVGTFTYNPNAYGELSVKRGTAKHLEGLWYDERILEHIVDERVEIAPGLVWCGEMNISPTRQRPLSGLESYTARKSGVFPHPRFALESIPSGRQEPTKFNYTTGALTREAYLEKTAGQKAKFHHGYGALVVEINSDGDWWVRQLAATKAGDLQDLDLVARRGKITTGNRVEAITWPDVHTAQIDPALRELCFARGGVLDQLRPRWQFIHDLLDFYARNHHERDTPSLMRRRWVEGKDRVDLEVDEAAALLDKIERRWCQTVVVNSNHDLAMDRWADWPGGHSDPPNKRFWHELNAAKDAAIDNGAWRDFILLEWALRRSGCPKRVRFLHEDESFVICGDIENGMHGDRGANGSRGTPIGLSKMGRRINAGHNHTARWLDGVLVCGTLATDLCYTRGPSSHSATFIATYPNRKRALVTIWKGKFRA